PEITLDNPVERLGEAFGIRVRDVRPLRQIESPQLPVVGEMNAGSAAPGQQQVPGRGAWKQALVEIEVRTRARRAHEQHWNAARPQRRHGPGRARDRLVAFLVQLRSWWCFARRRPLLAPDPARQIAIGRVVVDLAPQVRVAVGIDYGELA